MIKVVFLSDDFPPLSFGGAGISTYELAAGVKRAGYEVSVITTCRKVSDAGEFDHEGLHVIRIQSDYDGRWRAWVGLYNPPVVLQVEKLLKRIQPDVVHANNIHFYLSYHCLKIAKRYAKTVVWTARDAMAFSYGKLDTPRYLETLDARLSWRDNLRQAGKRYNPLRNYLIRRYLKYADTRLAVSDALREALRQNGITGVETMHTGIDVSAWQASPEALASFRAKFGLEGKKVILYGGRLASGVQIIRAMSLVAQKENATLLVMGKEESAASMKEASAGLNVVYTGWITGTEKVAAYCAADIVWVPSTYFDAFPRSALEASAAGKPVIATKFGGAPELVLDGQTGYVVNPLHAQEIANATLDLLQHPDKAAAFGRAGRERVQTEFNLDDKVAELISHYEVLLRKHHP